jgi:hypothetical protein
VGFLATSGILNQKGFFGEGFDPDALDYINRIETADGQRLEQGVRTAINQFVLGCKADGIWTSLVTSCIMAGARTVAGAITPLVGNAPTNNNFVSGDYSRTLGLLGNDSNKYLATGYNNNDTTNFPQNDSHISCYVSASQTDASGVLVGTQSTLGNLLTLGYSSTTQIFFRNRAGTSRLFSAAPLGFQASTRNNSANFSSRATQSGGSISDVTTTVASGTPSNQLFGVFCGFSSTTANQFSAARMSFYSIGKSLSIPNLDTRVTTLMNTLARVIP